MPEELFYTVLIDAIILICMINIVRHNSLITKNQKIGFQIGFALIIVLSIFEYICVLADSKGEDYWLVNLLFNFFGFILSPFVATIFAESITQFRLKSSRYAVWILIAYILFMIIAMPFGLVYSVDSTNTYHRGILFSVFLIVYVGSKLYLCYSSYYLVKRFQYRNKITIILLLLVFILGSSIQIFQPDIHTSWSCLTLVIICYYSYFNELWNQMDGMTGLYTHQAYASRVEALKPDECIIIMDCDDFKYINDTYGHAIGDVCLIDVSKCIKKIYEREGICYRIGGDEFAVVLSEGANVYALNSEFLEMLSQERQKNPLLPFVSTGMAMYNEGDTPYDVKCKADKIMYEHKVKRKKLTREIY